MPSTDIQIVRPETTRITPQCDLFCVSNDVDLESIKEKMLNGDWGDITTEGKLCNDDMLYYRYGLLIATYPIFDKYVIEISHDLDHSVMEIDVVEYPGRSLFKGDESCV